MPRPKTIIPKVKVQDIDALTLYQDVNYIIILNIDQWLFLWGVWCDWFFTIHGLIIMLAVFLSDGV